MLVTIATTEIGQPSTYYRRNLKIDTMSSGSATKRVDEMTADERLESLKAWAEEQKYIRPGEGGTLSFGTGGVRDMRAQSYSGPVRYVPAQYEAPIAPPSYETATAPTKQTGPVKRWIEKRKERRRSDSTAG